MHYRRPTSAVGKAGCADVLPCKGPGWCLLLPPTAVGAQWGNKGCTEILIHMVSWLSRPQIAAIH